MQCHANSLARIESDWTFRDGDNSLITSISCTKQSNLVLHFSMTWNCLSRSFGTIRCLSLKCLPIDDVVFLCSSTRWCKVYIKPTNTGLLLHYQSHVDIRYKRGLLRTMLDRAYRLSSCWTYFSEECDRLKALFSRLKYPEQLINTTVRCFVSSKTEDRQPISATDESPTVRIVLPFKDQDSADFVRKQLNDLSHKTRTVIQPVFVSNKIEQKLKVQEKKPPIVNQQCVVYRFQCDLCDASYVGYTLRHLHQRVDEHKNTTSSIGKHFRDKHRIVPKDLDKQFHVIEKCKTKFDCLVHEMLVIRELSPSLNVQSDSIRAKLFAWHCIFYYGNLKRTFSDSLFFSFLNLKMVSWRLRNVVRYYRLFLLV